MKTERNQKGMQNPREGRPKTPDIVKGGSRDNPLRSCHRRGRSAAEDPLTMISYGVEISMAGGGADEKDEAREGSFFSFFFFLFYIMYSLLSTRNTLER